MLNELKKLNYPGRKDDILYFLQVIIGRKSMEYNDINVLCTHAPVGYQLNMNSLVEYCMCFGWIQGEELISLTEEICGIVDDNNLLNQYMVESTLKVLFENKIFTAEMFVYDLDKHRLIFRNELLPLSYSSIRNVLVSQELFVVERKVGKTLFWAHTDYEKLITKYCKNSSKMLTLEQLKKRLEDNAVAGAKAEEFALKYEKARITDKILNSQIMLISEIDVGAGYDLVSYESNTSTCYDRFIEVKAISKNKCFYWSKNEFSVAKLHGDKYHLYLVDLSKINDDGYSPLDVKNPAITLMESTEWFIEPESYHIRLI